MSAMTSSLLTSLMMEVTDWSSIMTHRVLEVLKFSRYHQHTTPHSYMSVANQDYDQNKYTTDTD